MTNKQLLKQALVLPVTVLLEVIVVYAQTFLGASNPYTCLGNDKKDEKG